MSDNKLLNFLYHTIPGRACLKVLTAPFISKVAGSFLDSKMSTFLIDRFIESNGIDMADYEKCEYASFNEFFRRSIKKEARPINYEPSNFIAPCDGNLTVYKIDGHNEFEIKNSKYMQVI